MAKTGWGRFGGRFAERPSEGGRGRFRKRPPVVFGVVRAVIEIGWIKEAAARLLFSTIISMAPKYKSPLKTAGCFEPEQISIDVTVTSPVSVLTLRCAASSVEEGAQWAAVTAAAKQLSAVTMASFIARVNAYSSTGGAANVSRGAALWDSTLM